MRVLQPALSRTLLLFFLIFTGIVSRAQTVTGTVTDKNQGPIPRVTVTAKNGGAATTTNTAGQFSIKAEGNDSLVFSSVGYTELTVAINRRSTMSVNLAEGSQNLDAIVVTALGISKDSRRLGYSTTAVKSDELTVNRTPNMMNAIQGKVAGVNISGLSTGPGGTSKIRIRGQTSFGGQNNPLIVINGVPITNPNFSTNTTSSGNLSDGSIQPRGGGNTSDGGDGLSSINPDDIENMTILKGAAAAALYGYRASNGVIMITTKTKGKGKGIGVTYNVNYTNEKPLDFTDFQYVYGQGENGVRPTTPNPTSGQWSFGEKIEPGMTQVLFNNLTLPYEAQRGNINKFFRNAQNLSNTITMESSSEKGGFHMSVAHLGSQGVVPNNTFDRKSVNIGFSYDLSSKLSFSGNGNYSIEKNTNPPNVANQDNSIPTSLYNLANTLPLDVLNANKYNANGDEYIYSRFMNRTNPYWVLAEQFQNIRRDRIFGNVSMKYDILPWMFVQLRVGQDFWTRDQDINNFPTGHASRGPAPAGFVNGIYTQDNRRYRETNADFLVSADKKFGDFGVNLNVGGNQMKTRTELNSVQVTDFIVRGLYTVQNGRAKDPLYNLGRWSVNSLYGSAELSWKDLLYVTGTVRNDWFSTLSPANRSITYPSVSGSLVFSEWMKNSTWLTMGKLRVGYGEVGSDSDVGPYANILFYGINANLISNPAGLPQPIGGPNTTLLPNANLRPMRISETEIGLELKMFNNRVNLDLAAYRKITADQIVTAQISDASGFVNTRLNSGRSRNLGVEALLSLIPVQTKNFRWEFTANTNYNITKVLSITTANEGERITVGSHVFNGEVRQVVGQEMGQIAGFGYKRTADGQRIFGTNGLPVRTDDLVLFGSALPKWVGGFTNSFNYKGINLSFLIDYKLGNKMLSGSNFNFVRHGLHQMTLEGREGGFKGVGVNPSGSENSSVAPVQQYWEHLRSQAIIEPVVYNGGYWKLRQVNLGYDFTKMVPEKWPVKGVRLSFVMSNVLVLKKWVDNIDPESMGLGSDNLVGMEAHGLPTTRGMGLNLNVKF
ncbi:MAG: SusC/RagA family TonB-linked outer membrane protein [Chitinophagaceae bacterium]|nr:MAG: SusC/RagA family TonB-linked outer membrane protein [Chitinophagaceae bacterium]